MKPRIILIYTVLIFLIVVALLYLHIFFPQKGNIDITSVLLVVILLLIPYLPNFRKLRFGSFEAEIDPSEVTKIEKKILKVKNKPKQKNTIKNKYLEKISKEIILLGKNNPELALVKLRIELEKITTKAYLVLYGLDDKSRSTTSYKIKKIFKEKDEDRKEYLDSALLVISICNRAAHGERIDEATTFRILFLGLKIVAYLYGMIDGYVSGLVKF